MMGEHIAISGDIESTRDALIELHRKAVSDVEVHKQAYDDAAERGLFTDATAILEKLSSAAGMAVACYHQLEKLSAPSVEATMIQAKRKTLQ